MKMHCLALPIIAEREICRLLNYQNLLKCPNPDVFPPLLGSADFTQPDRKITALTVWGDALEWLHRAEARQS